MDRFYNDLKPFRDFDSFTQMTAYTPVPDDWSVIVSDIRNSTRAIEKGRYKDVNVIGAACITAVLNICGDLDIPYVFGGDGASLAIPESLSGKVHDVLLGLRRLAREKFEFDLRTGMVNVADLRSRGVDVRVRKFELSPGNHLAMFCGHGMELAEALIKEPAQNNPYCLDSDADCAYPDLTGLSCRWEPLRPRAGRMVSLMVRPTTTDPVVEQQTFAELLNIFSQILGNASHDAIPVSAQNLKFRWPPRGLKYERLLAGGSGFRLRKHAGLLLQSLVQFWCERFDRKAGSYDAPVYRKELRRNADYRKYDDVLRMVLDVSPMQADALKDYCQAKYHDGTLVYGMHIADSALMTCLLFNLEQGEHIHFIDGNDGGFALAARDFKARMKQQ